MSEAVLSALSSKVQVSAVTNINDDIWSARSGCPWGSTEEWTDYQLKIDQALINV